MKRVLAGFAAFAFLVVVAPPSGAGRDGQDWPAYGGGPEQIRYSTLAQINRSNVRQLQGAWTYDSGESGGLQTNPIIVDGGVLRGLRHSEGCVIAVKQLF
jgi:quinoprotein glucose dehydrogenase